MIRPLQQHDLPDITAIYNHYISQTKVTFEEDPVSIDEMTRRVDAVKESGLPWIVAQENDSLVGYAYAAKFHRRSAYRFTVEISAYLAPGRDSQGWGTKLYETLFPHLQDNSIHCAIGVIALPNAASVALHEKFGMEKIAHMSEVGFKFGDWIDVGYWQLKL